MESAEQLPDAGELVPRFLRDGGSLIRSSLPAIEEIQMSQLGGFSHLSVTQESAQDQSTLQSTLHSTLPAFRRSTGEAASSVFPMSQQRASMLPTSYLPGSKGASTTSLHLDVVLL
ncbi:unnamed protein product [Effrenium voratum]|nr:unnamed protein product [Effrenium voratum]